MAIDNANGTWAAMSAITHQDGDDYDCNLITGVDLQHRGFKPGQAVKDLALRTVSAPTSLLPPATPYPEY